MHGLGALSNLGVLDLSGNKINRIEVSRSWQKSLPRFDAPPGHADYPAFCPQGISSLKRLHTLLVATNQLHSIESVKHLAECHALVELDLSRNRIADVGEEV